LCAEYAVRTRRASTEYVPCFADLYDTKSLLGRCLTAAETRALEGCIRYYLRTGETS
jgi:hypothetical protein